MQGELPTKASGLRKWRTACLMVTILIALLLTLRLAVDSSFTTIGMLREGGVTTGNLMASPEGRESSSSLLADTAFEEILTRGAPILGNDANCHRGAPTCSWMAKIPDSTKLIHMNLPGTHDTATWNYTKARQKELLRYTGEIPPAHFFRCQQSSIFQMLNDGIRVFDLRYAYNPGNDTIGFYHCMRSHRSRSFWRPQTTLIDVLYGYSAWLERHPTETILLSLNHEGNTGTVEDERIQEMVLDIFSKPTNEDTLVNKMKRRFWIQKRGELGTLGESRGKIILLQRFSYRLLNPSPEVPRLHGLDLGADRWTDNGDDIHLVYNPESGATAFIEDRYAITLPPSATPSTDAYITAGPDAQTADQLFITFASAAFLQDPTEGFYMYPRVTVRRWEGNTPGMNERLLHYFEQRKGQRFGVIMLDFYDAVPGLVETILGA
ncbi:PLC-like phosphodiesterase [Coprinellus micaceus]|uniref:PLC-like phosphodiesterase n=1 Tax=Coprinellus micaceus TaxID=71717 RepID=A0A4Y7RTA7_COPMI|nr:PLC-like phosphodiesterase [Coprinellus micaceus]